MDAAVSQLFFREMQSVISALMLGSMRMLGVTFLFPLFAWTRLTGPLRLVFALAVSLPVALMLRDGFVRSDPGGFELSLLLVKEFLVGAALGFALAIPFWAAQAAGDVVDLYRGASAANLFDPMHAAETSVLGTIFILFTLALFVVSGGIMMLIAVVFETYRIWPADSLTPRFTLDSAAATGFVISSLVRTGLVLAGPLLLAMLLADLGLVLIARGAAQFPVFELSVTAKNLVLLLLAPLYALFFHAYLSDEWMRTVNALRSFLGLH